MHRRVVDLEGTLVAAVVDVLLILLIGVNAGHVDAGVVDVRVAIGHPVRHNFAHTRAVFDPHRLGVPQAAHLGRFTDRRVAVGRHLQKAIEGIFVVITQFGQDGRELNRSLQRRHDLVQFQIALRRRQARLLFFQQIARVAHARVFLFVIAPFDLAALWGFRVTRIPQIGRVTLVAQQGVTDVFARTRKFQIGLEESERVVHRHDGQVFPGHIGNQAAPQTGADHHVIGRNKALGGFHALDAAVLDAQTGTSGVGKGLQLA